MSRFFFHIFWRAGLENIVRYSKDFCYIVRFVKVPLQSTTCFRFLRLRNKYRIPADTLMATSNGGWSQLRPYWIEDKILSGNWRFTLTLFSLTNTDSSLIYQGWVDRPDLSKTWAKRQKSASLRWERNSIQLNMKSRMLRIRVWYQLLKRVVRKSPSGRETQVNYPEGKSFLFVGCRPFWNPFVDLNVLFDQHKTRIWRSRFAFVFNKCFRNRWASKVSQIWTF